MSRILLVVLLGLSLFIPATSVQAQTRPLTAAARAHLVEQDSLLNFRTQPVTNGRYDVDAGVLRAAYRIEADLRVPAGAPAASARAFLEAAAPRFGWAPAGDDLDVVSVVETPHSSHVVLQQTFFGRPVYHRRVKVSLDRHGQPTMVLSGYAPHLRQIRSFDSQPALSADAAAARVREIVTADRMTTGTPELVVYPSKQPRLAWRLLAWPSDHAAEWEILLDAHSGELIQLIDQSTHAHGGGTGRRGDGETERGGDGAGTLSEPPELQPPLRTPHSALRTRTDGSGLVFIPDPLTSAGIAWEDYGPPYADADDADVPELNAQRREVVLRDIEQGTDGLFRLRGPYVQIDGSMEIGGTSYTPPAEADPNGFRYGRANPFFEAVMAYYHIDQSQRYVQSLGMEPGDVQPIRVNPHGLGTQDNSRFFAGLFAIAFGEGGVDDAEDADVIWHEYAHAVLERHAPGLRSTQEGQALHEGWADYWAASYSRSLIESGAVPGRDWRQLFDWDGHNGGWCGRRIEHTGHYPDRTDYTAPAGCAVPSAPVDYQSGLLWATTLMDLYPLLGREVLDRLNLASHFYLEAPVSFRDAAEALVQADRDLYDGAHMPLLLEHLGARGYVDPASYGPVLTHEMLADTEQLGGTVPVEVRATGAAAPVDSVVVVYGVDGAPAQRLVLHASSGDHYTGALPLPSQAGTVYYYVEAVDGFRQRTRLPAGAPDSTYRFTVGPDTVPPSIQHTPVASVSLAGWPLPLVAGVQDNLGVDSVWVEYTVHASDGAVEAEGRFGLDPSEGAYQGIFPVPASKVQEGTTVRYRIRARDRSMAHNEAVLPENGTFSIEILSEGVLRAYTFESTDYGVSADGIWARGRPAYGLHVAHSGANVWATGPDRAYPAAAQRSTLELPPFNLAGAGQAYLVFWHWYDFEHNGLAVPGRFEQAAALWDGGNVKVSVDGGRTWAVAEPEGGYSGVIQPAASFGNPLGGERAFGGYSYGWRREVVPLPVADDVRIRFEAGTDLNNTDETRHAYAGWYLDDVTITTQRPEDTQEPVAASLPPAVTRRAAGQYAPSVAIQAEDDTGLEAVLLAYRLETAAGVQEDTVRLAMSEHDLRTFAGTLPFPGKLAVGDRITYRLFLRDFDGNEAVYPAPGEAPFLIEYLLMEQVAAFAGVRTSGVWGPGDTGWRVQPGDATPAQSSLVLAPFDLPSNGEDLHFVVEHGYALGEGRGGNVRISLDDGRSWMPLEPDGGYPGTFDGDEDHPMAGEGVFTGTSAMTTSTFDLAPYGGQQVRLRIDFGAGPTLADGEYWSVYEAYYAFATRNEAFETPRELRLHANFPDPFASTTTVGFTIPEEMPVRLAVFDMLGRRVAVLVHARVQPGTYTSTFDASGLAAGVYMLRLETPRLQLVERLVVAR